MRTCATLPVVCRFDGLAAVLREEFWEDGHFEFAGSESPQLRRFDVVCKGLRPGYGVHSSRRKFRAQGLQTRPGTRLVSHMTLVFSALELTSGHV